MSTVTIPRTANSVNNLRETPSGLIFMAISWLVILGLFIYSFARTLCEKD